MTAIMPRRPANTMHYKGYNARVEYDDVDQIFTGRLLGIQDIIVFHGDSVEALQTAMQESVDDYLAACEQLGQPPQKPGSGKLMIRIPPELHSTALTAAQTAGVSLNQWVTSALRQAAA